MANSSMFVRPNSTASAALSRATTVASYGGRKLASIRERAGRQLAAAAQQVLDRHRHAGQRPTGCSLRRRSSMARACSKRLFGIQPQKGADLPIVAAGAIDEGLRDFQRREAAGLEFGFQLRGRKFDE